MVCEQLEFTESEDSTLRTARLALRRPRAGDAEAVARLANDREIAENTMVIPYPYTLADARKFIAHVEETRIETFLAFAAIGGEETLIGCGGLTAHDDGVPTLGYWVGAPYRGRGFATEIARALIGHAFETLGAQRLGVSCRLTNTASRRVIEKCGFQWTGCGLSHSAGLRGSFPVDRFRLERAIWKSLLAWGSARAVDGIIANIEADAR